MVGPIYRLADIFGRYRYIGICKLNISISHVGNVSATLDMGYIVIGQISVKILRYRPNMGIYQLKYKLSTNYRLK
jgi:hypothetical protein